MGRRKKVSDARVLEAALAVLGEGGREHFTLSRVASAAGVAAATLVQRFRTRDELLVAAMAYANGWLRAWLNAQTQPHIPTLLGDLAAGFGGPEGFGQHLAFLREDLSDPALAQLAGDRMAAVRTAISDRLTGHPSDRAAAAELIEAHWHGAVAQWGIRPQGRVSTHVERSLRDMMGRLKL